MKELLLILLIAFTCKFSFPQENDSSRYEIKGKVSVFFHINLQPDSEAVVVLTGEKKEQTKTDMNGEFEFLNLKKGKYSLKINSDYGTKDTVIFLENKSILNFITWFSTECTVNRKVALLDIKSGKPKLLIYGGIAPSIYINQKIFENRYGIEYYSYGDCDPPPYRCVIEYNRAIFEYLTKHYGKKWRKEVRKDVVGIRRNKAWR